MFLYQVNIISQSISEMENNYSKLQSELNSDQSKLDSLKNILNLRAKKIDEEKSKPGFNKDAVTSMMAGSISLSNEIEALQKKIDNMQMENEKLKMQLNSRYTGIIDSLKSIGNADGISGEKKKEINNEVFLYAEKKLIVSPKVSLLSFYPDKIIGIDLSKINDESQRNIYKEYLQNALSEVNDRLKKVNENIAEVENIITLQRKTRRFLEETEFETNIPGQSNTGIITQTTQPDNYTNTLGVNVKAEFSSQVQQYSLLLSQLQQPLGLQYDQDISKIKMNGGSKKQLTYQQYIKLLKDTKGSLQEYRLILQHKIGKDK